MTAAGTGRSSPAGTVASRQNAHISSAVGTVTPAWPAGAASPARTVELALSRETSSATASSPSSALSASGALGRGAESMLPLSPLVSTAASDREVVPPSPVRGTRPDPPSHQAASPKTAPSRDDRRAPRSLAF